ncbi:MAG TPA: hypothetical protein DIU15_09445 [Deltaproteobacteria bacterium]|nr:hypothetical protein [Deltaproteobacteria bacterium]HCP46255.1 hypothetical protein [Deltaproteobacteria bacterium]
MSDEEEHGDHERWVISYADFITLLFATFVALYACSIVDQTKMEAFSASVHSALNASWSEKVLFKPLSTNPVYSDNPSAAAPQRTFIVAEERCIETAEDKEEQEKKARVITEELQDLEENEELAGHMKVEQRGKDVVVSLLSAGLFSSARAELQAEGDGLISELAKSLQEYEDIQLRVEGHTDNRPLMPGARYRDNWELSSARATTVVNELVSKHGFQPEKLVVAGLGEFHPVDTNETDEGRARNRRIDIVIQQPKPPTEEVDAREKPKTQLR